MGWSTYVGAIRLHGRERFYLQRTDDRLSGNHPVLRDSLGDFALYDTESDARAAGRSLGEPVRAAPPYVVDLDAVLAWCLAPTVDTLDYGELMSCWHTLVHFEAAEPLPDASEPHEPDFPLTVVADKVHEGYAATDDPPRLPAPPEWSPEEILLLATTLSAGVRRLAADVLRAR